MTNFEQEICRLPSGAIDIDFYHRQARVLRSEKMTAFFKAFGTGLKPAMVSTVLTTILFAVAI